MKTEKSEITEEMLLKNGWTKLEDEHPFLFEKKIENRNPLNSTPEDTDIKLSVHMMYNQPQIAIVFPDGGMLNFNPDNLYDLSAFERMISFYDCPY